MFSQLEEEVCNVGGEGFWAIPVKNGDRQTSVNNGIPKVDFRRWEIEGGGNTEGDETKGLKMSE